MSDAFADIAGDREIKVLIHTGTGANDNANWGRMPNGDPIETPVYQLMPDTRGLLKLDEKAWYSRHLVFNVLDGDMPMISAVNGPCNMHSGVPLMGDIVLASEDAYFQDASHFPRGQVPGAGQHVIWSEWGVANEVQPKDKVPERAWELAHELVKRPPLTLRYSRQLFTNQIKRAMLDELGHGLARETYAQRVFSPSARRWSRWTGREISSPGVNPRAWRRMGNSSTTEPARDGHSAGTCHRTRLAQEVLVDSTTEFAMQDVNTIEATHWALKTRAQNTFHLSDQELLIRQFTGSSAKLWPRTSQRRRSHAR